MKDRTLLFFSFTIYYGPKKIKAINGIIINTIGVGSETGVPIPNIIDGIVSGYKKDNAGNTVVTKLDSKILQDISAASNGVYVQATSSDIGLDAILNKIARKSP